MNRIQWVVLGIFFVLLSVQFMRTADSNNCLVSDYRVLQERLNYTQDEASYFIINQQEKAPTNEDIERVVGCVADEKTYEPFISLSWGLAIVCFILAGLEPKQKKA